jgi:hypothetical protein
MADFMTRLAERALGRAPVVQPLISPTFADEQTESSLDLEWDNETTASPAKLTNASPVAGSRPTRDEPQEARYQEAPRRERATTGVRMAPPRPEDSVIQSGPVQPPEALASRKVSGQRRNTRMGPPEPDRPQESPRASVVESGASESEEDQRITLPVGFDPPQKAPEPQPGAPSRPDAVSSMEPKVAPGRDRQDSPHDNMGRRPTTTPQTNHHAQPGSTRRSVLPAPHHSLTETPPSEPPPAGRKTAEDPSSQVGIAVEGEKPAYDGRGTAVLSPANGASPHVSGATPPEPEARADRSVPGAPLSVAPRAIRPRPAGNSERGAQEEEDLRAPPAEPSAPAVRVSIGRIEVRAITPPPTPPAQRTGAARPEPGLSLDDYLKQRNGG